MVNLTSNNLKTIKMKNLKLAAVVSVIFLLVIGIFIACNKTSNNHVSDEKSPHKEYGSSVMSSSNTVSISYNDINGNLNTFEGTDFFDFVTWTQIDNTSGDININSEVLLDLQSIGLVTILNVSSNYMDFSIDGNSYTLNNLTNNGYLYTFSIENAQGASNQYSINSSNSELLADFFDHFNAGSTFVPSETDGWPLVIFAVAIVVREVVNEYCANKQIEEHNACIKAGKKALLKSCGATCID